MGRKKTDDDFSHLMGWIDPKDRTDDMHEADAIARSRMPAFAMLGPSGPLPDRVVMTELWDSEEVQAALGFKYPGIHQITGSCVGAGGGDVIATTLFASVIISKLAHRIVVPYWLYTYGKGRVRAGIRGPGDGSFGTAEAAAAVNDGFPDAADPDLPKWNSDISDGLIWGGKVETTWSDGAKIPSKWDSIAKQNVIGTTAVQDTTDAVKVGLQNWYAHTVATSMYCNPKNAKVKEGMVVGAFDSNGGHQTKILGYKLHPVLGDMFYNVNNWGNVYPLDPETGRRDGCWITKQSMQWACSQREVIAYSGVNGFQARVFDWKFS